jgi:hypothetical protein
VNAAGVVSGLGNGSWREFGNDGKGWKSGGGLVKLLGKGDGSVGRKRAMDGELEIADEIVV